VDIVQLLILAVLGVVGGMFSGLVDGGGGIIFVPALVYAAGWDIKEAVAASLVVVVFASLSGTLRNLKSEDPIDWRVAALLSSTAAPASLLGVYISRVSPEIVVQVAFATLLLALAYPTTRGPIEYSGPRKKVLLPLILAAGVFIGTLSGLVGVGGGVLLVPLMVLGLGLQTKRAVSTSLAIVLFVAMVGGAGYIASGFGEELLSLPPLIVGSMLGAWPGVRLREIAPQRVIRYVFAIYMVLAAVLTLVDVVS
jgi:uncharacterized membrane protein YfcA